MNKSNKAIIVSFMISVFCLSNSAVADNEYSQANEVSNKQAAPSKVVVLYDHENKSSYRDNSSLLEKQLTSQWHEEIGNNDTGTQVQIYKQADNQHELKENKATPVPEPSLFSMLLAGIGLLLLWSKLFKNRN